MSTNPQASQLAIAMFEAFARNSGNSPSDHFDRNAAEQWMQQALDECLPKPAAAQEAVAFRLHYKTHGGEWSTQGRPWADGKPDPKIVAEAALPGSRWKIEYAYAAPVTAAPVEPKSPSYDGLLLMMQSVCGALSRAGLTDCDDPGEAIDVIRERLEKRVVELERQLLARTPAAPGIDLEQFREAVAYWRDTALKDMRYENGPLHGQANEAQRLLDLIDASPKGGSEASAPRGLKLPNLPFAVFDEFGVGADDRIADYGLACAKAAIQATSANAQAGDAEVQP